MLSLDPLRLTFSFAKDGRRLSCGEPVQLAAADQPQRVAVRVENNATARGVDWWGISATECASRWVASASAWKAETPIPIRCTST
ncbi:hypothetical protein GGER_05480 [Serratia rubidaea]